jgi:hypothetical protein
MRAESNSGLPEPIFDPARAGKPGYPRDVSELGDFNSDLIQDLVAVSSFSNQLRVWTGIGS